MYNITRKVPKGKSMDKKRKKQPEKSYPAALTIACSDSGGSSGIQADLRTFNAFGVFGSSALTAVKSGNPLSVSRVDQLPAESVASQIDAVCKEIDIDFAKTGMLGNAANIRVIASAVKKYDLQLVCDPEMFSARREALLDDAGVDALKDELLPLAKWVTPNAVEAGSLSGMAIEKFDDLLTAAKTISEKFGVDVWIKGGIAGQSSGKNRLPRMTDVICRNGELWKISSLKVDLPESTAHGAGCTLSAARTATLALDIPWEEAICAAKAFVMGSLVENIRIGRIHAMYPPTNDYMNSIQLEKVD